MFERLAKYAYPTLLTDKECEEIISIFSCKEDSYDMSDNDKNNVYYKRKYLIDKICSWIDGTEESYINILKLLTFKFDHNDELATRNFRAALLSNILPKYPDQCYNLINYIYYSDMNNDSSYFDKYLIINRNDMVASIVSKAIANSQSYYENSLQFQNNICIFITKYCNDKNFINLQSFGSGSVIGHSLNYLFNKALCYNLFEVATCLAYTGNIITNESDLERYKEFYEKADSKDRYYQMREYCEEYGFNYLQDKEFVLSYLIDSKYKYSYLYKILIVDFDCIDKHEKYHKIKFIKDEIETIVKYRGNTDFYLSLGIDETGFPGVFISNDDLNFKYYTPLINKLKSLLDSKEKEEDIKPLKVFKSVNTKESKLPYVSVSLKKKGVNTEGITDIKEFLNKVNDN